MKDDIFSLLIKCFRCFCWKTSGNGDVIIRTFALFPFLILCCSAALGFVWQAEVNGTSLTVSVLSDVKTSKLHSDASWFIWWGKALSSSRVLLTFVSVVSPSKSIYCPGCLRANQEAGRDSWPIRMLGGPSAPLWASDCSTVTSWPV